ncbi:MAG: phosphotransferase, partial [Burkholderiaceae bacterium]
MQTTPIQRTQHHDQSLEMSVKWDDTQRGEAFAKWLSAIAPTHQLDLSTLVIASADASFRRYLRIRDTNARPLIIMDAPPDKEDCAAFAHIAQLLQDASVAAPHVLAWDATLGFMLLTDLGQHTLLDVLSQVPGLRSAFDIAPPNAPTVDVAALAFTT